MKLQELKQLIRECIIEDFSNTTGIRNIIQTVTWNIYSNGYDNPNDGYSGDKSESYTADFTVNDLIEILGKNGIVDIKTKSVKLLPDFLDSNIYTKKGLYTIDIDFINNNIKPNKQLMIYLISELNRETSGQIKTSHDFIASIKSLMNQYDGGPVWLLLEFLENKNLPEYQSVLNSYCVYLIKGLYQYKYELNIDNILNKYTDDFERQYDYTKS